MSIRPFIPGRKTGPGEKGKRRRLACLPVYFIPRAIACCFVPVCVAVDVVVVVAAAAAAAAAAVACNASLLLCLY